ncbi:MAG: S9 family peptidase [Gammaproteobacteria bacterium]|nr:S9 family peptidase [Gammaproteobacteria bacterium]MDH3372116.1 S9 family peptidase [Gammaproteobacteria bacterium]MDH3409213.1 S9 family peptidase [Gammaproteobacteria bacterium]MDH3551041.1 S9 family peptidase [Gammaproteobacteria bacterium]
MRTTILVVLSAFSAGGIAGAQEVSRTVVNNGNLLMEDVPAISEEIVDSLNRFQNVRSAGFAAWQKDGSGLFVKTRFADVEQLHRVDMPRGARHQLTFYKEPVGVVSGQPQGSKLIFTRDVGGSEFTQIFMLDPATGSAVMLSDGESRNGAPSWDRDGRRIAYPSTRRNGASNDIWLMYPEDPDKAEIVLESPDGTWWGPTEFSASGNRLLALNYVSIADSRVHLIDLDSGEATLLAGGTGAQTTNYPVAFDDDNDGFWLITSQGSNFQRLAWQAVRPGAGVEIVTNDIDWDITNAIISHDRRRIAFTVNEDGMSRVYLMDTRTRKYRPVDNIPIGLAFGLGFSPDDRKLAMTLNTASTPSDTFVLDLGPEPLQFGQLVRWTTSEVGGLDTTQFREPQRVTYPTFDKVDGLHRQIPAWVYKPAGDGPFPVVVSIHGGPESQSRPVFSSTYQMWMQKLGVAIVVPNVRGSNGYGKEYLSLDNGFKREDSVRDIGALLDWVERQPDLDADRVAVFGGSYGGYMVLASAVHFGDRLKAVVDIVGISNFVTFLENTQDYRRDLRRAEYGDERDPEMRAHLEKISPVNNVDRINVPIFVVQGQNDPRVPVTESEQMVDALRKQGNAVWYMNAFNEGHGYRKKENRDIYQQATVLFLREHLIGEE